MSRNFLWTYNVRLCDAMLLAHQALLTRFLATLLCSSRSDVVSFSVLFFLLHPRQL